MEDIMKDLGLWDRSWEKMSFAVKIGVVAGAFLSACGFDGQDLPPTPEPGSQTQGGGVVSVPTSEAADALATAEAHAKRQKIEEELVKLEFRGAYVKRLSQEFNIGGKGTYSAFSVAEVQLADGNYFYAFYLTRADGNGADILPAGFFKDKDGTSGDIFSVTAVPNSRGGVDVEPDVFLGAFEIVNGKPTNAWIGLEENSEPIKFDPAQFVNVLGSAANVPFGVVLDPSVSPLPPLSPTVFPTEAPTQIVDQMSDNLNEEQKTIWENTPSLTNEGLTKSFLDDPFSEFLGYKDPNGIVRAVYWEGTDGVVPALMVGNQLFLSENKAVSIKFNEELGEEESRKRLTDGMIFFRAMMCAISLHLDMPNVGDNKVRDFIANHPALLQSECEVILLDTTSYGGRRTWFRVERQNVSFAPNKGIVFVSTSREVDNLVFDRLVNAEGQDYYGPNGFAMGVAIENGDMFNTIYLYMDGSTQFKLTSTLGYRLNAALEALILRATRRGVRIFDAINFRSYLDSEISVKKEGEIAFPILFGPPKYNLTGN